MMGLNWKRPQFIKQLDMQKPAPRERKLRRIRLKWKTKCTGCQLTLEAGMVVAYEGESRARFCTRCVEKLDMKTTPTPFYSPPRINGPRLVVENGRVRYVDDQEAATDTGSSEPTRGVSQ